MLGMTLGAAVCLLLAGMFLGWLLGRSQVQRLQKTLQLERDRLVIRENQVRELTAAATQQQRRRTIPVESVRVTGAPIARQEIESQMRRAMEPLDHAMQQLHRSLFDLNNQPMLRRQDGLFRIETVTTVREEAPTRPDTRPPPKPEAPKPEPEDRFNRILKDE